MREITSQLLIIYETSANLLPGLLLLYNFIVKLYKVIIWSYCLNLSLKCNTFVF